MQETFWLEKRRDGVSQGPVSNKDIVNIYRTLTTTFGNAQADKKSTFKHTLFNSQGGMTVTCSPFDGSVDHTKDNRLSNMNHG